MKDGQFYEKSCYDLKGSPQNPVGFDELVRKFNTAASGLLSQEVADEVRTRCASFEKESGTAELLSLLNW